MIRIIGADVIQTYSLINAKPHMLNRIISTRRPGINCTEEYISSVKGFNANGVFEYSVPVVINYIKQGFQFYVQVGKDQIPVTYKKDNNGKEFIKTEPDAFRKDNLLNLPPF